MHDLWTDRLSDYLDDDLPREEARDLEAHLEHCADCRLVLEELKQVKTHAASLVDPPVPDDLWAGIATRIGAAGSTSGSAEAAPARARVLRLPARRHWTFSLPQIAAAGFVLVCASAALFWSLRGSVDRHALAANPESTSIVPAGGGSQAAGFDATEVEGEIAQLQQSLERGRDKLDPHTVKVLETNLTVIRKATEDARRALAADPANADLQQYLSGTVRRKLDLMKRATAMAGI